jgi:hypothetical protein
MAKNIHKGPKVGRMDVPISKLKNEPLTKSIGPILYEKYSETIRKYGLMKV